MLFVFKITFLSLLERRWHNGKEGGENRPLGSNISFTAQGSNVKEIDEALSTASKRGTGHVGYPEYVAVIDDFILVVEDKASLDRHIKLTDDGVINMTFKATTNYAVNGAYFYAKHIA